jgi:hypothetical protein
MLLESEPRYFYAVVMTAAVLLFSFIVNWPRIKSAHLFIGISFLLLAVLAKRNIILFFMVAAPVIIYYLSMAAQNLEVMVSERRLSPVAAWLPFRRMKLVFVVLAVAALSIQSFSHVRILSYGSAEGFESPFRYPAGPAAYIKKHPVPGNIFNSIRHGGYMIWHFYPPKKVFIDGRLILRSPEFFAEYLTLLDEPALFPHVRGRYNITQVVLPIAIFDRYTKLAEYLYHDTDWRLVVLNESSALFVLDEMARTEPLDITSPAVARKLVDDLQIDWQESPFIMEESIFHLGSFLMTMEAYASAEYVLEKGNSLEARYCLAKLKAMKKGGN